MRFLIALTLIAASQLTGSPIALPVEAAGDPGQIFMVQDYRWIPVNVRRTPTAIDSSFEVVGGSPTVHAELVSEHDFQLFARRHDYETFALTQTGRAGGFHRMIETKGRYRVLIVNDRGAAPVAVSLVVRADVDPAPAVSSGISPRRRLVVVLASLTLFFGTVTWSGRRLLRAWRNR